MILKLLDSNLMKKHLLFILSLTLAGVEANAQHKVMEPDSCLISKYYFNSGTVNDDFGPNNGTQVGATLAPDRFGNANAAWYLTGNQYSYLNFGTTPNLKPNDISVSMWFKITATSFNGSGYSYNPLILTKCQTGNNCFESYCLYYDQFSNKIATACTQMPCSQPGIWTLAPVPLASWHHIVFTYDNSTITLYLDAVSQGTVSKGFTSVYLGSDSVMVGNSANIGANDRYFNGTVDDIRFYHCVIPQSVVTTLYNEPNWFIPTVVNNLNANSDIKLSPNPNNGDFTISLTKLNENTVAEVYNPLGQILFRQPLTELKTKIDLSKESNGIYFVKVLEEGKTIFNSKLIKQ